MDLKHQSSHALHRPLNTPPVVYMPNIARAIEMMTTDFQQQSATMAQQH